MHDLEIRDGAVLPGIVHFKREIRRLPRFDWFRQYVQVEVVLDRIRQSRDQRHSASGALAGTIGTDIRIHWANVDIACIL